MSRIPTFASSSSSSSSNVIRELPISRRPRRSKSVCDLRSDAVAASNIFTKYRAKVPAPNPAPVSAKMGLKRPAPAPSRENIPAKIVKKPVKIPDWDYKSRFAQLQDKHKHLVDEHRENLLKISEMGEMAREHSELKASSKGIKEEKERVEKRLRELEHKYAEKENVCKEQKRTIEVQATQIDDLKGALHNFELNLKQLNKEIEYLKEKEIMCNELQLKNTEMAEHIENLKVSIQNSEQKRRQLHNEIQDLKGNIRVFCRLRPPLNDEEKLNQTFINIPSERNLEIGKPRESIACGRAVKGPDKLEFNFDKVFDRNASQEEIFEELAHLIQSALDGYHVCVFAYGQTGSGKTHTMQGSNTSEHLGMIPRSIKLIFDIKNDMEMKGWLYNIKASFLEVYNEHVQDLLDTRCGKALDIRFNEGRGTTVSNLTIIPVSTIEEFNKYMQKAQQTRFTAATNFNDHSSRSHAVTKIYIEGFYKKEITLTGSVSLVDLAGSESAKFSTEERLKETKYINKSLTCLGNVLMALNKKDSHIPYRDSKLTFLLQSSLGGNCKCLMIANISPVDDCYNETLNVLRFATKVKEVKTGVSRNKAVLQPK